MKKETLKEKEVEEEIITTKNSHKLLKIIVILVIIIILGLGIFICYKNGVFDFSKKKEENAKTNIKLKHSGTAKVKSEGVYVTDVSDVVEEVMPSIVAITSKSIIDSRSYGPSFFGYGGQYKTEGAGSGIIVAEDDNNVYILTNYHVVKGSDELSVKFNDDSSYDAGIKGTSERKDIAIVYVSKKLIKESTLKEVKIATIGSSDELKVGNGIIAIGNALGYGQSVTTGVVSALNREIETDDYVEEMIQIDAAINGGNSGGALLNSKGEVVGINTAKYSSNSSSSSSVEGMGFAIPISDVEELITSLINGENDSKALTIGIEGYMTTSSGISEYGLPSGFYIANIVSGGNAEDSELEIGNIITQADNTKISSLTDLRKVLNRKNKGDSVTLKVKYVKGNEYLEKEVTIKLDK